MIAEILSVGTELLMGQVLNSDAHYIAKSLAPSGIDLYHQTVVGDNPKRLKDAIALAFSRSDVVLFTGGLGPTDDDLTKETVAEAMGFRLEFYEDQWQILKDYFESKNRTIAPNNRKQVLFPRPCRILPNPNGTAPGCIMEKDGKAAILLPGPPRELIPMFDHYVNDPKVTRFLSWQPHGDIAVTQALVKDWCRNYEKDDCYHWAIEYENKVIGGISVVRHDDVNEHAEIGYCIGSAFWGKGLMTEAARAVLDYLLERVNFHRVVICHAPQNPASGRVAQKCGLTYEGTLREACKTSLGEYLDLCVYSQIKKDS